MRENQRHLGTLIPTQAISEELARAEAKFPSWPIDPIHGIAIVAEEAGEAVKATMHLVYENGSLDDLQKELIQTAAMAIRFLSFLERQQIEADQEASAERIRDEGRTVSKEMALDAGDPSLEGTPF